MSLNPTSNLSYRSLVSSNRIKLYQRLVAGGSRLRLKHRRALIEALERRMLLATGPAGLEFQVNTYTANGQWLPSVAMDADGGFVVAWESRYQDGSEAGVYARRYNASGAPQGAEFRVNTYTAGAQGFPSVAMAADGDFVVAWRSYGQDGSRDSVYAQRYNALGVKRGAEFRVNSNTTNHQTEPSVAMDAAGEFVVAWQSNEQDGSGYGVYAQRYNSEGVAQGGEFRVNTYTAGGQIGPSVAMDAVGNFLVTWTSAGQDGDNSGVYAQRYDAEGVPQGNEFRVNTYTIANQSAPSVAMDSNGDFIVAWHSNGQDGGYFGIYAQRYNAAGVVQGGEFRVNTHTAGYQTYPCVAMDADGNFIVAWQSDNQDGSFSGVYAQRFNAAGGLLGHEFRVNTYTDLHQYGSSVAMDAAGDFVVAWQSSQDGSGTGVYSQLYRHFDNPASVGSFVWNDANGNGLQDAGEAGVDGVTVKLFQEGGIIRDTTITAGGGLYRFDELFPGQSYYLEFLLPANFLSFTQADQGADDTLDSDANSATGRTAMFTLAGNEIDMSRDTGLIPEGVISGVKYNDLNSNGIRDASEPGLPGWVIYLDADNNGQRDAGESSTMTDAYGDYRLGHLFPGDFVISDVPQGNWTTTSPIGGRQSITLSLGQHTVVDFNAVEGVISGVKYNDLNSDGQRDAGENGLPGWIIYFDANNNGQLDAGESSTTTEDGGAYRFGQLSSGDYVIAEVLQTHWTATLPLNGRQTVTLGFNEHSSIDFGGHTTIPDTFAEPKGPEFHVYSSTTDEQSLPAVAMDADGDFVLAWHGNSLDNYFDIYAQRYNIAGVAQGGEFRVNTVSDGFQTNPSVAMDADGDFIVAWQSIYEDGAGYDVYAQRYNAAGELQGGEFRVNTYTNSDQRFPSVAMDADGDFLVAWASGDQDGDGWGVYAQRYSASGERQGDEFLVSTYTTSAQYDPSVAMDAAGNFIVAWQSYYQDGGEWGVYAQRYSSTGVALGGEFRVNINTYNDQRFPSVAMGPSGDFIVSWMSDHQDGSEEGVYAQRFNSTGVALGGEFRVNTYVAGSQSYPSVVMDTSGGFIVAWTSDDQDGGGDGVYAQRYNAAGVAGGAEFRVNTYTTGDQRLPSVAFDAAGDFIVAWTSDGQDGSGYGVYTQRYSTTLDLTDNSLIVRATPETRNVQLETLTSQIASGRNTNANALWTGPGITSSTAAQSGGLTGLGILLNDDGSGQPVHSTFANELVGINDILIKYTWVGDLDLNGVVDADDYFRIDRGFASGATAYSNGDIDYSGTIDADDYFLMDSAFARQSEPLAAMAGHGRPALRQGARNRRVRHHVWA